MLHLKKVLGAKPKEHVEAELATLFTPWGEALDINHVLEEHPSPQFARSSYRVLNGVWNCTFTNSGHAPNSDLPEVSFFARSASVEGRATAATNRIVVVPPHV